MSETTGTQETTAEAQTSAGAQTLPGELQACYVVLLERHEAAVEAVPADVDHPDAGSEGSPEMTWFERLGEIRVPVGTKRSTVLRLVQDGQHDVDSDIPQVSLQHGERGRLHVVPEEELGAGVVLRGVQRIVFVPAGDE